MADDGTAGAVAAPDPVDVGDDDAAAAAAAAAPADAAPVNWLVMVTGVAEPVLFSILTIATLDVDVVAAEAAAAVSSCASCWMAIRSAPAPGTTTAAVAATALAASEPARTEPLPATLLPLSSRMEAVLKKRGTGVVEWAWGSDRWWVGRGRGIGRWKWGGGMEKETRKRTVKTER